MANQLLSTLQAFWPGAAVIVAREHQRAQRADGVGMRRQHTPAVEVGAQQIGQQLRVGGVTLGAVAAIARAAGLDRVGVNRKDLTACVHQRIDDQARGALDGDTQAASPARQAAQENGQAVAVVRDLEAIEHRAGGVDEACRIGARALSSPTKTSLLMDRLLAVAV